VLTAAENSDASLWDARTGEKVLSVQSWQAPLAALSPDGSSFATSQGSSCFGAASDCAVSIWNAEDGRLMHVLKIGTYPYRVAFSPDGGRMLISTWGPITYGKSPRLWDVSKETEIATLAGHKSDTQLAGVMFSHDGGRIATVSLDGSARLWDGKSGRLLNVLGRESAGLELGNVAANELDQEMNSVFSQDDRYLATTSLEGTIRIWDVDRASLLTTLRGHAGLVKHIEFSPVENNLVLAASHDGTARLWDVDGVLTTALPHEHPPTFAIFSPDNLHVLTGGGDSGVRLWDAVTGRELAKLDNQTVAHSATFSPDGSRVATASLDGQILVWDVVSRREVAQLKSRGGVLQVRFSPNGTLLSSGSGSGTSQIWGAASGAELAVIKTSARLPNVVFSRDGNVMLAATNDNVAHLLKPDGTEWKVLIGHQGRISAADFSPDGRLVATGSLDGTARIWSVKDGSSVATLKGHGDELTVVSFSQDDRSLLTASRNGTVRIWSVPDGTEKLVLKGHSGDVGSAQFSPNGAYVVTASSKDRTVRLWEARSGREIALLAGPSEEVVRPALTRAAFNSDGTKIAIVSRESVRIVRVFPTLQDLIAYAQHTVPRELTACERRRFFLPVQGEVGDCPS
jgi:WD40 repeat protein